MDSFMYSLRRRPTFRQSSNKGQEVFEEEPVGTGRQRATSSSCVRMITAGPFAA